MTSFPPPEGMSEDDYDSIHAAVVETVRGRWFLAEYARRSRVEEVQEMLAAIGRLETVVLTTRALPPPQSDMPPHLRLLTQRVEEIAGRLASITEDLRESGADPYLCDDLEAQIRAFDALTRGSAPNPIAAPQHRIASDVKPVLEPPPQTPPEALSYPLQPPAAALPSTPPPSPVLPRVTPLELSAQGEDRRLAGLAVLDRLSLPEKLALFS
jgi:hypothetical protein